MRVSRTENRDQGRSFAVVQFCVRCSFASRQFQLAVSTMSRAVARVAHVAGSTAGRYALRAIARLEYGGTPGAHLERE